MKENVTETVIGAVVLVIAAGFLLVMNQTASLSSGSGGSYPVTARFQSAEGIVIGSDVRLAGIKVGRVTAMALDPTTYLAETTLAINEGILIPDDSQVGIASEGLLGGAFVEVSPGASEFMLTEGQEVVNTQGAVSLINLLLRFSTGNGE